MSATGFQQLVATVHVQVANFVATSNVAWPEDVVTTSIKAERRFHKKMHESSEDAISFNDACRFSGNEEQHLPTERNHRLDYTQYRFESY